MKTMLLTSGLVIILFSSFLGMTLYNEANTNGINKADNIKIDTVSVSDPGYRCFTTPCFFRLIKLNFTVTNSQNRTLNTSSSTFYSLKIISDSNQSEKYFGISDYQSENINVGKLEAIPAGIWNDSYSALLTLGRMPASNEQLPTRLQVQLTIGNGLINSSIFSIDIKI